MMSEHRTVGPWTDELKSLAKQSDVDLKLEDLHYHTYFYRGYSPQCVINDIIDESV